MNARLTNHTLAATAYALRLRGIRVQCHMGVSDAERAFAQELVVAVDLELPGQAYPMLDELERAADYAEVVRIADELARETDYLLLETFALRVGRRLGDRFPLVELVRIAVTKATVPVTPHTDQAIVELTLSKGFG
jgi:dihydroneopterin aldolase